MVDAWIKAFYTLLNTIGYGHPVHPTQVHLPIGLVVGAFVFCLGAMMLNRKGLWQTAHSCTLLALFFWFPTVISGLMDWRHFYHGAWIFAFKMKMILAAVLLLFLIAAVLLGRHDKVSRQVMLAVYAACFSAAIALGYFGGEIIFSGNSQADQQYITGAKLYDTSCGGCHPNGGNVLNPGKPVKGSPKLLDFPAFLSWIRSPSASMPAFPESAIREEEALALYNYVTQVVNKK